MMLVMITRQLLSKAPLVDMCDSTISIVSRMRLEGYPRVSLVVWTL